MEVIGLDLSQAMSQETFAAIFDALCDAEILLFRGQDLSPQQQLDVAGLFGPLKASISPETSLAHYPQISVLSNVVEDDKPVGFQSKIGIEWHTDGNGWKELAYVSTLYALEAPQEGGDTLYASGTATYQAASPELKDRLEGLQAVYSDVLLDDKLVQASGQGKLMGEKERRQSVDVVHPVVWDHPVTSRRAILASPAQIKRFKGIPEAEGRDLIERAMEPIDSLKFHYRHQWRAGDLMIHDNRSCLHSTTEYTYRNERRRIHQTIGLRPDQWPVRGIPNA